jgi:hypothetical protein
MLFESEKLFMKINTILCSLALLISIVALIGTRPDPVGSSASSPELNQFVEEKIADATLAIRAELVEKLDALILRLDLPSEDPSDTESVLGNTDLKNLVQLAKHDHDMARLLRAGIESVILMEMADELDGVDWLDTLSQEKIQKLLTKTAASGMTMGFHNQQTAIDVSDIPSAAGKVDRILEEFEGVNSYSHDNALVKQLAEMGDEAIDPLIAALNDSSMGFNWARRMAVTESLEQLLTEEHEEIILAEFTKSGNLSKLIDKYQFPAAEDEVMNKIAHPSNGRVDKNVIDAALMMNSERSIPILMDYVSHGQNVSYAAGQLAAEGLDITEPLRLASARAANIHEQAQLVELCLEREMPQGYDLAIQVLRSKEPHAEHSQERVYQYLRKYTGINGNYDEVADWLQDNQTF